MAKVNYEIVFGSAVVALWSHHYLSSHGTYLLIVSAILMNIDFVLRFVYLFAVETVKKGEEKCLNLPIDKLTQKARSVYLKKILFIMRILSVLPNYWDCWNWGKESKFSCRQTENSRATHDWIGLRNVAAFVICF